MNDTQWLYPLLVAAFLAAFGWLLRNAWTSMGQRMDSSLSAMQDKMSTAWTSIEEKIDDLEASYARVTSDIVKQHAAMEERLQSVDKRLVRVESWKELFTMPDFDGRRRRVTDRFMPPKGEDEQ